MAPKCRILAFFVRNGEMASDSVLMDVENGYKNEVSNAFRLERRVTFSNSFVFLGNAMLSLGNANR